MVPNGVNFRTAKVELIAQEGRCLIATETRPGFVVRREALVCAELVFVRAYFGHWKAC